MAAKPPPYVCRLAVLERLLAKIVDHPTIFEYSLYSNPTASRPEPEDVTMFRKRRSLLPLRLSLALAVCAFLFSCSDDSTSPLPAEQALWIPQDAPAQGRTLRAVWASSPDNVFAVGDSGTVLHYDGTSWKAMSSGTTRDLNAVHGSSADNVYAVGSEATIIRYDGLKWTLIKDCGSCAVAITGVWVNFAGVVITCTEDGGLGITPGQLAGGCGVTLRDMWGNEAVAPDSVDVWAVGVGDPSGSGLEICRIFSFKGTFGFGGLPTGTSSDLHGVWGTSGGDIFVVGEGGTIVHYDGIDWSPIASGTSNLLRDVWGSSATDVYAVGDGGTILHGDVSGWELMNSGTTLDLYGIGGSSAGNVFAVGQGGIVLHRGP